MYFVVQIAAIGASLGTLFALGLWFVDVYIYIDDGKALAYCLETVCSLWLLHCLF